MTKPETPEYRFQEPRNTRAIVCTHVLDESKPILMVSHDADGDWQFLCGDEGHTDAKEAKVVSLESVVVRDVSLNELATMCTAHVARREAVGGAWSIEDDTLANIRDTIDEHGWWVGLLPAEGEEPAFAYTIGLQQRFGHPELIVFGLALETMHVILNTCGELVREGASFAPGVPTSGILRGHDVSFRAVRDRASLGEYLGYATRYYGDRPLTVLQCLWPDKAGRFPGEPGAAPFLASAQPLIP